MRKNAKQSSTPMSEMSAEDKEFFRQLLDLLKLFYCQRQALFQICESELKNWEPVYRVVQTQPEITDRADPLFAAAYASIEAGKRNANALGQFSKDVLPGWKPN